MVTSQMFPIRSIETQIPSYKIPRLSLTNEIENYTILSKNVKQTDQIPAFE